MRRPLKTDCRPQGALLVWCLAVGVNLTAIIGTGVAAEPTPAPNGAKLAMDDELLDHLVGQWKLTGKVGSRPIENRFEAKWVLGHQFLELHFTDSAPTPTYEALVYIGFDNAQGQYVAHWLDVFGGKFSETLGFGTREGNALKLAFDYPDAKFRDAFSWNPDAKTWHFHLEQKSASSDWTDFAVEDLQRITQP